MSGLRHQIRDTLRASPLAFGLIGRRGEHPDFDRRLVRRGDDLVIEGYPRSGNTFGTMAFRMAQDKPLNIGNHFHAPAQVLRAAQFGLPSMVVFRAPEPATMSFVVYHQGRLSPLRAVEQYIAFHAPLVTRPHCFSPAPFEEVITDFGASIDRMNAMFGSAFSSFEATDANTAAVKEAINAKRAKRLKATGKSADNVASMTTPSEAKKALQAQYAEAFQTPAVTALMTEAKGLHQSMCNHPALASYYDEAAQ